MTPERWKQIDDLAQAALERGGEQREAFLDEACADDEALRREVESQIAYQKQASKFLEEPAFKHADELIADPQTETESMEGRTISHYSILRKLGAGGMGEVYLAQDTTLGYAPCRTHTLIGSVDEPHAVQYRLIAGFWS